MQNSRTQQFKKVETRGDKYAFIMTDDASRYVDQSVRLISEIDRPSKAYQVLYEKT